MNKALLQFYDETIKAALASPEAAVITENELRSWFETELITEAGTRGFVHRGKEKTGGLPNAVVGLLQNRFLVRVEERSGGAWVELVHDRFVEPIRSSNGAWFAANRDVLQSVLQRQAASWDHAGRPEGMLLEGEALLEAERWAQAHHTPLEPHEQVFLDACRESSLRRVEYERQRNRRMQVLTTIATAVALLALVGFALAAIQSRLAMASSRQALGAQSTAVSEAAIRATAQIDAVSQAAAAATAESIARSEAEAAAAALAKAEAQATIATENKNSAEAALALFATQQAALQRTPTPAPAAGPAARTPKPGGTATVAAGVAAERTVQAIQAQLAQSAAKQEALAATPARAQLSQLYAVVEGFPAAIYSKPDYNSQQVASIAPPARVPALDVQNVGDVYWIQVQTDKGEVGWLEGGVFTYEGDRNWLPAPLRIMMTGRQGVVVSYNDQQTYRLVNRPQGGRPVGPEFPVGTGITILATERGDTTYGSGRWYLVLLISPERRLRGYLPVEAVQEVQSTTN